MNDYNYAATPDPYCYPGTSVLLNKLGIKDAHKLAHAERRVSVRRYLELTRKGVTGRFGYTHLKAIHAYLLGDLYPWAGMPREFGFITKGGTIFCRGEYLDTEATRVFGSLANENRLKRLPPQDFVRRMAYYNAEINALHPFREGNGRATRAFLTQLAAYNGYELLWRKVPHATRLNADICAFNRNYAPLERVLTIELGL